MLRSSNMFEILAGERDFRTEKPETYMAFVSTGISRGPDGFPDMRLTSGMCADRHVGDLCACLTSWFRHEFGEQGRNAWRFGDFDLTDNNLMDESVCQVMDHLKSNDIKVRRLRLAGNRIQPRGVDLVTEYIWNCQEPLAEIDVSRIFSRTSSFGGGLSLLKRGTRADGWG